MSGDDTLPVILAPGEEWCSICEQPVDDGQPIETMESGGRVHKLCFDIVVSGLAADLEAVVPE